MAIAVEPIQGGRIAPSTPPLDVLEAIRTRRSVGRVRPECPPRDVIEQLLEAATWAPNHRLTEPWRFFVLAGDARHAFGEVLGRIEAANSDPDSKDVEARIAKARAKPLRAPVIIVAAVVPVAAPKVVEFEEITAGAAAVQNLLLAAHAAGLAAIWRTGAPCYEPVVKEFFGLPEHAHLLGFIYAGYPDGPLPRMTRKPAADCTRWLGWDEPASVERDHA